MKIAKYIGDLIFDYECVVIPGLGGFISTNKSAQINKVTHQFKPPVKDIHFNIHLKANDGLLINYVARNEGLSYKEAKQKVDKFVLLCNNALDNGKKINFSKIGYIYRDSKENIVFNQDISVNYNADSFGLSSFVSPAIRRPSDEDKIKEVFSKSKTETKKTTSAESKKTDRKIVAERSPKEKMIARSKPSKIKQQLAFIFVVLFVVSSYFIYSKRDAALYYWDNHKHMVPFLYNQPHDFLAANAGALHLEKVNVSSAGWFTDLFQSDKQEDEFLREARNELEKSLLETENSNTPAVVNNDMDQVPENINQDEEGIDENAEMTADNSAIADMDAETSTKEVVVPEEKPTPKETIERAITNNRYFIIAGSFGNITNAERLVKKLKDSGFEALIADTNGRGLFRVAYMGFSNAAEAEQKLYAIRKETNSQAWLLEK